MPWNVNGTFALNQDFVRDRDLGRPSSLIDAVKVKDEFTNVKAGLEQALSRQGYNTPSANIPWGGYIITGYGTPASRNDVMNAQATSRNLAKWCTLSGSSSAWTATNAMASNVLLGAVEVMGIAPANANAGCTFALGVTAATEIRRLNGDALVNGDIRSGSFVRLMYISPYWRVVSPLNSAPAGDPIYVLGTVSSPDMGTPNVYAATVTNTEFPGLRAGQMFLATMHRSNTGNVDLGINGGGAISLLDFRGDEFANATLLIHSTVLIRYNGTDFRVVGSVSEGGTSSGAVADATDVDMGTSPDGGVLVWDAAESQFVLTEGIGDIDLSSYATTSALATKLDASAVSSFMLTVLDDANASAARGTLGLGTMAVENTSTWQSQIDALSTGLSGKLNSSSVSGFGATLIDDADAATARATLGLGSLATLSNVPDDNVTNARLANMAQNTIKGRITSGTGDPEDLTAANVRTILNISSFGETLVDDADATAARATLGVYPGETALTYGATTDWDVTAAPNATLTTTGNTTMAAPTNIQTGRIYRLRITKDIKANTHQITWNAAFRGVTTPQSITSATAGIQFSFIGSGSELFLVSTAGFG